MKKLVPAVAIAALLFSCKNTSDKEKFVVSGELRNTSDTKVYLEELFFSQAAPEVLDTGILKAGKFEVSALASEEGLYRLRTETGTTAYLFVNDGKNINFIGDADIPEPSGYTFGGAANESLKKVLLHTDSVGKLISAKDRIINQLLKAGAAQNDSTIMALKSEFKLLNDNFTKYCYGFADTVKSPVAALFAATMAPVEMTEIKGRLAGLSKRFPKHKGIAGTINYINDLSTKQTQTQTAPQSSATIGNMAPEITMNDVNDKPFSLSQLKGKYVLIDFWASWCGPCRGENPNIVAAYNQFKDKNFTVLGVSLDEDKQDWINAIAEDQLPWQHISDLKKWRSSVVGLYGIDGIPYSVLVDPQGKIIAANLRGSALQNKLAEVLK